MENYIAKELFLTAALFLGAIAAPGNVTAADQPQLNKQVLQEMHTTNLTEIETGKIAAKRAKSADVRAFGAQLAKDHANNDLRVVKTARARNVKLSNKLDSKHAARVSDLRSVDQIEFDETFVPMIHDGHVELLRKLSMYQEQLSAGPVKTLVTETIPVISEHQEKAAELQLSLDEQNRTPASESNESGQPVDPTRTY